MGAASVAVVLALSLLPVPPAKIRSKTPAASLPVPPPAPLVMPQPSSEESEPEPASKGEEEASAMPVPVPLPEPAPVPEPAPGPPAAAPVARPAGLPAWQAYAVPARPAKAMVAVIIDDMGLDHRRSLLVTELPAPLTLSYMSYAPHAAEQTRAAHARGHELMMHMPMQPLAALDAGPDVLSEQLPPAELHRRVESDLDRFSGIVGVNNHMGSKFTAYEPGMKIVMDSLRAHGLLFIDSMTTNKSVGMAVARQAGVPTARRNIFLDDVEDEASVMGQLARAEEQAKSVGSVIVIGHPHDGTIAALTAWLPTLAKKGITLVPVTTVVKAREAKAGN